MKKNRISEIEFTMDGEDVKIIGTKNMEWAGERLIRSKGSL